MVDTFDYIVVGAGSGGCVVTQRLVAAGKSVLLLEAGPADNTPFIHIPATFIRVIGTKRTWMYKTEAEDSILGRAMYVPQGRTLGGGSSVNAMIYIRGQQRRAAACLRPALPPSAERRLRARGAASRRSFYR